MSKPPKPEAEAAEDRARSRNIAALNGLRPFLRPYRWLMVAALAALTATAMISLVLPLAVRGLVDELAAGRVAMIDDYIVGALVIAGLFALGSGLRFYLVTRLGERVVADIRKEVFARVLTKSPGFFDSILTGEVLSRITTDTTLIQSVIGSSISVALRNILVLIGGALLMLLTSGSLTLMALMAVPVVVLPIVILGRRLRRLSRVNQDWIAASSGRASEALLSLQTVQAFNNEDVARRAFDEVTEQAFRTAVKRVVTRSALTIIVIFLVFSAVVGLMWAGSMAVKLGNMTPGEMAQFVIYAIMVAGSAGALSEIWGELQRAAGATERLIELLEAEDNVKDPVHPLPAPQPVRGRIAFEDVTFRYPSRPQIPALDRLSFTVQPGETVALVGPSGAGKTTVIQMLLRFYDPDTGRITLDGVPLDRMTRSDFRRSISMVPQDPVIFADTARENIRFGKPGASDAEVEEAARMAAAHDFIAALPRGYDSYVGERGIMLSGGQKQRIAIARAILRDAPVLLMDEATSSLDAESERLVQRAVDALTRDRTTIVIAHRLATVRRVDRILVFDEGRIVAQGSHENLVAMGGLYARLARLQFTEGIAAE
ncbi:MAG TPA: ABC transporter [Rhodobacteraceae bacterium]|jgi:ATP-binding cassette subfamily B protein|nr:ATP-binding cassette domain-containing protein [Paracoccaceae bacterium]HBG97261.1 ABC transporter [Paracoccaceae bacterium]